MLGLGIGIGLGLGLGEIRFDKCGNISQTTKELIIKFLTLKHNFNFTKKARHPDNQKNLLNV